MNINDAKLETKCLHAGYTPSKGEPCALPIYQSTTFKYDTTDEMGQLFDLKAEGYFYTRLQNPTNDAVAAKIASLEGGVAALLTSSGQAANFYAVFNICEAGDHVVAASTIYGGTFNLLGVTLKKLGIDCTFVDTDASPEEIAAAFRPNTKVLFAETIANPALVVLDIEKFAKVAHDHQVPLIVDNTFATPVNCRPFEWGADIVTHSTTKYMDGHGLQVGGAIIDSGNFDWEACGHKYHGLTEPDESYHGIVYTKQFGKKAYITKATSQLMRDLGSIPSPMNCFILNIGLETLPLRMERHCFNAQKTAEFLAAHPKVSSVNYPGLPGNKYYELAKKYLPNGSCGVISFELKGGREAAVRFMDSLDMANIATHVAASKTMVLHPASHTHRQMNDEQLLEAGVSPGMIRLSVGIEHIDDILKDLSGALQNA
ncbi:MAG TPA: O-acetylhomoserine aminocarboxypropyltransferase/cysteine synthase [Candidatus Choladousia intestinigallinarum]|nr:O-acetylhomoserine aminocarboxypropyltransferase/cysteine synthase [Candidatus Choladousia intestinigallinarum]